MKNQRQWGEISAQPFPCKSLILVSSPYSAFTFLPLTCCPFKKYSALLIDGDQLTFVLNSLKGHLRSAFAVGIHVVKITKIPG